LSDGSPVQNSLKQGDALSSVLFNFTIEYAIRKIQENQVRLKLNGTHQLLAYIQDVNPLGDDIDTTEKNTGANGSGSMRFCLTSLTLSTFNN
jgi:hypothetical protein